KVPAALAAVAAATAFAALAGLDLPRVDLPSWSGHTLPELPQGPVLGIIAAVLTITLVGSVESLMSSVATDKLIASARGTGERPPRADLDRELRGQGAANIVSGMLGGLPVAAVAVRSAANVKAGAVSRKSAMLHGLWVVLAAGLLVPVLDLIPLAALAALVLAVGIQVVSITHLRTVTRYREVLVYAATIVAVVFGGVLEGVTVGIAVAVALAMHRLARTRITLEVVDGVHRVRARGQLTFLAVPRLSRVLNSIPHGGHAVVELDGSFIDHAAYEILKDWQDSHNAHGGSTELTGRAGAAISRGGPGPVIGTAPGGAGPEADRDSPTGAGQAMAGGSTAIGGAGGHRGEGRGAHHCCRPWTPWQNHCDHRAPRPADPAASGEATAAIPSAAEPRDAVAAAPRRRGAGQLASGISAFQRDTAPHVRDELARLAREGQRPSQLFLTCADSRLVTSMITASGPGDLFTVRNVGNLVPLPGAEATDDSVAAAIEYAVDVLQVDSITVCGHSGCGAMQALLNSHPGAPMTPLRRWLRHGLPSLERMASRHHAWARIAGRLPADAVEQLCLTNVVQQLEHLRAHESVARRLAEGTLELHGMYFHVGEAQAYLLSEGEDFFDCRVFDSVGQNA
ncbi:carbonic anhydrase, partial [Streptomyces sp. NPDC048551]|uniref:carbonic anhydrase n=1 Tax=Streptomyces sp. NPDC048551 TaxID=3155758 RepID=UPI0034426716